MRYVAWTFWGANVAYCAVLTLLGALSGCEYITGKTARQTMKDASIATAVQTE